MTKTTTKPEVFTVKKGSQRDFQIRMFTSQIEGANKNLKKFREDMEKDPMYAFKWADSSFEAAAKQNAFSQVLFFLNAGETMENIRETLTENVMVGAKYIPSSTSPTSNYIKMCHTAQLAEALNMFRHIKDLEEII